MGWVSGGGGGLASIPNPLIVPTSGAGDSELDIGDLLQNASFIVANTQQNAGTGNGLANVSANAIDANGDVGSATLNTAAANATAQVTARVDLNAQSVAGIGGIASIVAGQGSFIGSDDPSAHQPIFNLKQSGTVNDAFKFMIEGTTLILAASQNIGNNNNGEDYIQFLDISQTTKFGAITSQGALLLQQQGTGPKLNGGTGVPTIAGAVGDLYVRTNGGALTTIYRCTVAGAAGAATWTGIV